MSIVCEKKKFDLCNVANPVSSLKMWQHFIKFFYSCMSVILYGTWRLKKRFIYKQINNVTSWNSLRTFSTFASYILNY